MVVVRRPRSEEQNVIVRVPDISVEVLQVFLQVEGIDVPVLVLHLFLITLDIVVPIVIEPRYTVIRKLVSLFERSV